MNYTGMTICLYGVTSSGKSTQAGELAKYVYKTRKKKTVLNTSDRGGYDTLGALVRKGIVLPNELGPADDPWIYTANAANGKTLDDSIGLVIFDSGTSIGDTLLSACGKADFQIGQQKNQRFTVSKGAQSLSVVPPTEAQYGVVQGFLLDQIRVSTWLTHRGIDVLWTFGEFRSEEQDRTPIIGPKGPGKALTPILPREFRFCFRLDVTPVEGENPVHRLYLSTQSELAGLGKAFSNSRYPMGVDPLPPSIEPADLAKAVELIEEGQRQADALLDRELSL